VIGRNSKEGSEGIDWIKRLCLIGEVVRLRDMIGCVLDPVLTGSSRIFASVEVTLTCLLFVEGPLL
jgi:hypothetical protein